MAIENIVMLFFGIGLIVLGYLLIAKEKVAEWGLSNGSARIWVAMLGMERAKKLTRYFFGPLVILFGLIAAIGSVTGAFAAHHH